MRELKIEFNGIGQVKGYYFVQLINDEKGYLYEVRSGNTVHYEIFRRVENTRFGIISYPSNKAFGIWAWTCPSLKRAEVIFEQKVSNYIKNAS